MGVTVILRAEGKTSECSLEKAVSAVADDDACSVWIDVEGEITTEIQKTLEKHFGLHPLVVEDLQQSYALPKIEEFPGHVYVCLHAIGQDSPIEDLGFEEVDVVCAERWVVTHHRGVPAIAAVRQDLLRGKPLFERGAAFVMHALLDRIVDDYLPKVEGFDVELDKLEAAVLGGSPTQATIERTFVLKRSLFSLRRVATYQREMLVRLARQGTEAVPETALPFFRDVCDHMTQVLFLADSYRELAGNVLEMHLSMQGNRLNEIMKTLTMFSTLMLPLSLIAGIYGMNFEVMPELKWKLGYPYALGLMALVAAGVLGYFRRKKWL